MRRYLLLVLLVECPCVCEWFFFFLYQKFVSRLKGTTCQEEKEEVEAYIATYMPGPNARTYTPTNVFMHIHAKKKDQAVMAAAAG